MELAEEINALLKARKLTLATAESCTGGGIAACITAIPGSSECFKGGVVAYSNEVKSSVLHVKPETLERYGAVSQNTVSEMARGVQALMGTDCAIATSGIAGPGGGTPNKPVGTIWIAVAYKNEISFFKQEGDEGRAKNVQKTIKNALYMLREWLK